MPRSFCFARISRCIHVRRRDAHSHSHHSPSNSHHNLQRLRQNLSTPASDTTAFGQPSPSLTLAPLILSKTLAWHQPQRLKESTLILEAPPVVHQHLCFPSRGATRGVAAIHPGGHGTEERHLQEADRDPGDVRKRPLGLTMVVR